MSDELSPDLIRRVLVVASFDDCQELFWRVDDGVLSMFAVCSDFFGWATSDVEPIETEADVELLEQAKADLVAATDDKYPTWVTELYAARRRKTRPMPYMFDEVKAYFTPAVAELFRATGPEREATVWAP